jgi:hypothetical protein
MGALIRTELQTEPTPTSLNPLRVKATRFASQSFDDPAYRNRFGIETRNCPTANEFPPEIDKYRGILAT